MKKPEPQGGAGGKEQPGISMSQRSQLPWPAALFQDTAEASCAHGALSPAPCPSASGPEFPVPQVTYELPAARLSQDVQV